MSNDNEKVHGPYVCIVTVGGIINDVWTEQTLLEAQLSLAYTCHGRFDGHTDDARVFMKQADDKVLVEVYSYNEEDFTRTGTDEKGNSVFLFTPEV